MRVLSVMALLMSVIVVVACPAAPDDRGAPSPSSAPAPSVGTSARSPSPEAAVAIVEQFYGVYAGKLTPALTALMTDAQRARAEAHTKACSTAKDGELPAACESDPYICAQDDVKMGKPVFQAPGTVVVAAVEYPDVKVMLALKEVGGGWKIDGFTCPAP